MKNDHRLNDLEKPTLSILVPTLRREQKAMACVLSILACRAKGIEIFLLNQGSVPSSLLARFVLKHPYVQLITTNTTNKSVALNEALSLARGDIVAFTDDDCVVSKQWINAIVSSFSTQPDAAIVTGNTYPYRHTPRWSCPPTIKTKTSVFVTPTHHKHIGYGNNFAVRKNVFTSLGVFKTWLGPGSVTTNCEDGELLIRALTQQLKIVHNKNMVVYHNKQLDFTSLQKQYLSYIVGETACYTFYALHGWQFAKQVIRKNCIDSYAEWKRALKSLICHTSSPKGGWSLPTSRLLARFKGACVGIWQFLRNRQCG